MVHEYLEFWVNEFRPIQNNIDDIGPRLKEPPFIAHWHSTAEEKPRSFNHQALLDKAVSKNLDDVGQLFFGTMEAAKQEAELYLDIFSKTLEQGTYQMCWEPNWMVSVD